MIDNETYLKEREPIIDKCEGCESVVDGHEPFFPKYAVRKKYCSTYLYPKKKWHLGKCNFCALIATVENIKKSMNTPKASRRRKAGGFV